MVDSRALEHMAMLSRGVVPLLISIPVLVLLGLEAWGFWRCCGCQDDNALMSTYDQMLGGLVILSAFTLKVFWAYLSP